MPLLSRPRHSPSLAGLLLVTDASWGVVDHWLERPFCGAPVSDYYQAWPDATVTGSGELIVVPATPPGCD